VENIALFSQFYTISWFGRYRNVLKDTNKQVEYTSREENLHALIGMKIINVIRKEHPELFDEELEKKILHEAGEAIKYEMQIIEWIVNGYKAEKLNSPILKEFIKNRMNESLREIGFEQVLDVDRELLSKTMWFEEQVLGNNQSDFFHSRPVEYSKKSKSFAAEDLF
jgi:ribonucleoside-diphosphate reductase beta chain